MPDYYEPYVKEAIKLIDSAIKSTRKRQKRASLIMEALMLCMHEWPEDTDYCICRLVEYLYHNYQ